MRTCVRACVLTLTDMTNNRYVDGKHISLMCFEVARLPVVFDHQPVIGCFQLGLRIIRSAAKSAGNILLDDVCNTFCVRHR